MTPIDATPPFFDAISFNGSFFAARNSGQLFLCQDLHLSHPKAVEFASQPPTDAAYQKYLVDLGGNLCLLSRIIDSYLVIPDNGPKRDVEVDTFLTTEFEIFKLDMYTRNWEKIFSLGDRSLFLGNCYTFSVVAADYYGCRSNCIYFTDDNADFYDRIGGFDTAICCCDNNKKAVDEDPPMDPFPESDDMQDLLCSSFSPPLWIIPYPS